MDTSNGLNNAIDYISPFACYENSKTVACVGKNGGTYDEWIREGFSKTVDLVYSQIKKSHDEDIYIYPLFYCARHSVELGLKVAIRLLLEIYGLKKCVLPDEAKESLASHDIPKLSSILKTLIGIDDRLCVAYSEATVYLADYQDDPLSDLFRYANAVNKKPNLASKNISSVDIDLLYLHFCQTKKKLSEFVAISEDLLSEYKQGTHTEKLSRKQLEEIAHLLPPGDQWTTPIFDEKKDLIIRKYRLPSRKAFNRAVEVIKNHREFRAIIGDEQRLPYLTEDAIRVYRSCADYLSFSYVSKDNDGVKEQLNEAQKKTKELRELSRELTSEQIAVFLALLDVGEFDYYSEQFDAILDYMKESNFDRMWSIRKIASNRDYIAAGLKKCGQPYFFSLLTENCTNVDSANKETVHL